MASSRVFIRGLPPTITEADFRRHFSQQGNVTDVRLFQNRRIGYIGYDSPEVATKAVKYFNRTFMRMSKLAVEIATPVQAKQSQTTEPTVVPVPAVKPAEGKRKRGQDEAGPDPELANFLETMRPNKARRDLHAVAASGQISSQPAPAEARPKPAQDEPIKRRKVEPMDSVEQRTLQPPISPTQAQSHAQVDAPVRPVQDGPIPPQELSRASPDAQEAAPTIRSDADWLRSRTSRLLGLEEEDEAEQGNPPTSLPRKIIEEASDSEDEKDPDQQPDEQAHPDNVMGEDVGKPTNDQEVRPVATQADEIAIKIRETRRLYIRNLAYNVANEDLQSCFGGFGKINEVHIPLSAKTGTIKGFAYVLFENADAAVNAWREKDGTTFKGRLLHILPATAKRETQLNDFALSQLPLKKQQQIKKRREAASTQYNWNSLYMNADSVLSSVADRFGISKSDMLDPTSSDAAVKQAHAETHLIQETKTYFRNNNVDLDAFKSSARGDTGILIKNIPYDAKATEIRDMFEQHGKLKKFLVPPSGVIAIAVYEQAAHAKAAFAALAYRKLHNSVLFLEKAPRDLFSKNTTSASAQETILPQGMEKNNISASDLHNQNGVTSSTLFVRNLNFTTTTERLVETFKPLDGFTAARVKTKTDPKKPGQILSMGFGFVEFKSKTQAEAALATMSNYKLDDHHLQVRFSQKTADAAEARRNEDQAKRKDSASTKIVIKNLPFETTKKDIRALFGAYGQLRSLRMPMKMDRSTRGFAFADFTTQKEASNALDALRDTHLLGRRLVLDYAAPEAEDAEAEIERMQKKVGSQINKVALQNLTGSGRKKFSVEDPAADDDVDE